MKSAIKEITELYYNLFDHVTITAIGLRMTHLLHNLHLTRAVKTFSIIPDKPLLVKHLSSLYLALKKGQRDLVLINLLNSSHRLLGYGMARFTSHTYSITRTNKV